MPSSRDQSNENEVSYNKLIYSLNNVYISDFEGRKKYSGYFTKFLDFYSDSNFLLHKFYYFVPAKCFFFFHEIFKIIDVH